MLRDLDSEKVKGRAQHHWKSASDYCRISSSEGRTGKQNYMMLRHKN